MEACAILPLSFLDAYPNFGRPGSLYAAVGEPHHCDGNPTPDIVACPGVGLTPFGGEADVQSFQCVLCLSSKKAVHLDYKRWEIPPLLEASI